MEVGLFTEFQSPPGMDEAQAFDEALAQMTAAEELGFDAVWLAEIHFQKGRSVLSSPPVIATAIAARTQRVRIGIAVQILPLAHPPLIVPVYMAEDGQRAYSPRARARLHAALRGARDPTPPLTRGPQERGSAGSTSRPNSSTVPAGSAARLTVNMSWVAPAASAARTCAMQSSGVPATARRARR